MERLSLRKRKCVRKMKRKKREKKIGMVGLERESKGEISGGQ